MVDRILLADMTFEGRHGVHEWERSATQAFEVDVELELDLRRAGETDDLAATVDYSGIYARVREIVEERSFALIEALAEVIAEALLEDARVDAVVVRVRKPAVQLGGPLAYAGVELERRRPPG